MEGEESGLGVDEAGGVWVCTALESRLIVNGVSLLLGLLSRQRAYSNLPPFVTPTIIARN